MEIISTIILQFLTELDKNRKKNSGKRFFGFDTVCISARSEMVDFGFEQGQSDFSRAAGCYPARRDFPPGLFPTVGGKRRNRALFRGFQKSENAARSQKMPFMDGDSLRRGQDETQHTRRGKTRQDRPTHGCVAAEGRAHAHRQSGHCIKFFFDS